MQGFGSMLRDYLEFYKISQTDFAERLGISTKHMNEILCGKTNMSEELMLGISLITDIDINLIFYVESKKRIYDYLNSNFDNEKEINKLKQENKHLNKIIDKFKVTLKRFIKWLCHKFSYPSEDELVRDFKKETYTNFDFEKQLDINQFKKKDDDFDIEY